jgi:hypothetical protein
VPKRIVMEQFHLTVHAPRGLTEQAYDAMRQALDGPRFQARLRRAARAVVRQQPALSKAKVTLTR